LKPITQGYLKRAKQWNIKKAWCPKIISGQKFPENLQEKQQFKSNQKLKIYPRKNN